MSEKLHKILARAGYGSRRQLEQWIAQGRVQVNGQIAQIGERIDSQQLPQILLDRRPLSLASAFEGTCRVLAYHKPEGEICSHHDPKQRPTLFSQLPSLTRGRWIGVGRLDLNSSGLLLLTNDGELANRLMHPRYQIQRRYAVRVFGEVAAEQLSSLQQGVLLADGLARFETIQAQGGEGRNRWFTVTVREGRNREVRRLWQSQGVTVSRLLRIGYGSVKLPRSLSRGRWCVICPGIA